ncbi:TPA: hypothetical protein R6471_004239 [Klebsiella pneumoniae]|nr:hypothetical protein [Klebsiella pneumoniae]
MRLISPSALLNVVRACSACHRGALELEQQRKNTEQEEARLALANAQ